MPRLCAACCCCCANAVGKWSENGRSCSLTFKNSPLIDSVELPAEYSELVYSALLCGVIRGALSQIQLQTEVSYVRDELKGAAESEIKLTLKEIVMETFAEEDM